MTVHFFRDSFGQKGYAGQLAMPGSVSKAEALDRAFSAFNGMGEPVQFEGPSASVGDVFVIQKGNVFEAHQVAWTGFTAVPHSEAIDAAKSMTAQKTPEWSAVGVHLYREDGRYETAWAQTPHQFADMVPRIQENVSKGLEVRITNGDDHLLFHSTKLGIEWDGIGITQLVKENGPEREKAKTQWPDR